MYCKTQRNGKNSIDIRLVSNKIVYLKWITKLYVKKIFDNDLVAIRKITLKLKVTLKLHKPVYIGMYILMH